MAANAGNEITFSIKDVIQPTYTGGDVSIDSQGQTLATCLGEDAVLTNVRNGTLLARIDGVSYCSKTHHWMKRNANERLLGWRVTDSP